MFCTDPADLLQAVIAHRGLSLQDVDVHVGIDGGQNWLKMGLTITERKETLKTGRACYAEVKHYIFSYILFLVSILFLPVWEYSITFEPVEISFSFKKVKCSELNFLNI